MESNASVVETAITNIISSLTNAFTTADIVSIVTKMVGAVAVYCVLWFGIRYTIRAVRSAVFRGKLKA